jgi:hypothetical protein
MKNRVSKSIVTRVSVEPMSRDADDAASAKFSREMGGRVSTEFVNYALARKSDLPTSDSLPTHEELVAYVEALASSTKDDER